MRKMKLNNEGTYSYSSAERAMFSLLSEDKRITSKYISDRHFGDKYIHGLNNVVSTMNRLAKKVVENGEPFRVASNGGRGPRPKEYWLEKVGT